MTIKSWNTPPPSLSMTEIQAEFGGSGDLNLSDYRAGGALVPAGTVGFPNGVSTAIPSTGAISFSNFYGAAKIINYYWIAALGVVNFTSGSDEQMVVHGIGNDSSNNIYICGSYGGGLGSQPFVMKYTSAGTLVWGRALAPLEGSLLVFDFKVTGSGECYIVLYDTVYSTVTSTFKMNSNGTKAWQRQTVWTPSSPPSITHRSVSVDSADNVYVTGDYIPNSVSGTTAYLFTLKYNSSGVYQSRTVQFFGNSRFCNNERSLIDSAGNLYTTAEVIVSVNFELLLQKFDSAGNFVWRARINASNAQDPRISVDGADNVFFTCGSTMSGGAVVGNLFMKFSGASATPVWQKQISTSFAYLRLTGSATDAAGNIYVCGQASSNVDYQTNTVGIIIKFDSAGNIVYGRTLSSAVSNVQSLVAIQTITVTGSSMIIGWNDYWIPASYVGNIYAGYVSSSQLAVAVLPTDGSKTGSYTVSNFNFPTLAYTNSVAGLTVTSVSKMIATAAPVAGTITLTDAAHTTTVSSVTFTTGKITI